MNYLGTVQKEEIIVGTSCCCRVLDCIMLAKSSQNSQFIVTSSYDDNWIWEFYLYNPSVYEKIKFVIMDSISMCDNMEDLIDILDGIFENDFLDFVVDEDDSVFL